MKLTAPVPGGPCWKWLSTSDVAAAKPFYTAFGRRTETDPREEAGGYTVAHLGDARVAALSPAYRPGQPPARTVSFAVEDADALARDATAATAQSGGGDLPRDRATWDTGCGVSVRGPRSTSEMDRGLPVTSGRAYSARS